MPSLEKVLENSVQRMCVMPFLAHVLCVCLCQKLFSNIVQFGCTSLMSPNSECEAEIQSNHLHLLRINCQSFELGVPKISLV